MAGERGPADIAMPPNQLSPIIDLAKYAGGQKQSESGSATTTGQTGPLEALLATLSDPNNLANLVASLFSQGAAQVPVLTTQFANATGTRTSNNSMLAQSLASLNTNIAQAIAQAVVDQQKTAAYAGGKIADTNKTQTSNKQTVAKPASMGRSVATGAGIIGGGHILNKVGDKLLRGMGAGSKGETAGTISLPAPIDAPPIWQAPEIGGGGGFDEAGFADFGTVNSGFESSFDPAIAADLAGVAGFDPAALGDIAAVTDFADFGSEVASFVDEAEYLADWADFGWFADGGRVGKRRPIVGYADGGTVRNRPNMGQRVAPMRTQALTAQPQIQPLPSTGRAPATGGTDPRRRKPETFNQDGSDAGGGEPGAVSVGGVGSPNVSMGMPAALALAALGMGAPVGTAVGLAAQAMGRQMMVTALVEAFTGKTSTPVMPPAQGINEFGEVAQMPPAITPTEEDTAMMDDPSLNEPVGDTTEGMPAAEGGMTAAGFGDSGDMGGFGTGAESGFGGPGDGTGDSGDGGEGFADGGYVGGKKKKPSSIALDTELIRATVGEVVLPVDVVDFIGRDVLDDLIATIHTPIRTGTRG